MMSMLERIAGEYLTTVPEKWSEMDTNERIRFIAVHRVDMFCDIPPIDLYQHMLSVATEAAFYNEDIKNEIDKH